MSRDGVYSLLLRSAHLEAFPTEHLSWSNILLPEQTASLILGSSFPCTILRNSLQRRQLAQHGAGCCANYLQYSITAYHPFLWNTNLKIKHFIKMWIVGLLFNFSLFGFWSELKKEKKKVRNNISRSVILEQSHWGNQVIHLIYLIKL